MPPVVVTLGCAPTLAVAPGIVPDCDDAHAGERMPAEAAPQEGAGAGGEAVESRAGAPSGDGAPVQQQQQQQQQQQAERAEEEEVPAPVPALSRPSTPKAGRRPSVTFVEEPQVHDTYKKTEYDRRGDRVVLTYARMSDITAELFQYKQLEMAVHRDSMQNTSYPRLPGQN